jgi:hypothetical protein
MFVGLLWCLFGVYLYFILSGPRVSSAVRVPIYFVGGAMGFLLLLSSCQNSLRGLGK